MNDILFQSSSERTPGLLCMARPPHPKKNLLTIFYSKNYGNSLLALHAPPPPKKTTLPIFHSKAYGILPLILHGPIPLPPLKIINNKSEKLALPPSGQFIQVNWIKKQKTNILQRETNNLLTKITLTSSFNNHRGEPLGCVRWLSPSLKSTNIYSHFTHKSKIATKKKSLTTSQKLAFQPTLELAKLICHL
jgi:hypothetical protein